MDALHRKRTQAEPLVEALAALLSDIASRLQHCEVARDRAEHRELEWAAATLDLSCSQPGTAILGIIIESARSIHLRMGKCVYLREWYESKNDANAWVREVRPLVDAVVHGRFTETVKGRRGITSVGTLYEPDGRVLMRIGDPGSPGGARIFPWARRQTITYEPYS